MKLDNFAAVFRCSRVANSVSKMFDFFMVSSAWVIIFDYSIDFNELEAVLGCLTAKNLLLSLFNVLWICFCDFLLIFHNNFYI